MYIKAEKLIVELTSEEAYSLACNIKYSIEAAIRNHWVNYPDSYGKSVREDLDMMNKLYMMSQSSDNNWMERELATLLATLVKEKKDAAKTE